MSNVSVESSVVIPIETAPVIDRYIPNSFRTGLAVKMKVRRADGLALDWGDLTFKAIGSVGTMLSPAFDEVDATEFPGEYRSTLDLSTVTNLVDNDTYQVRVVEDGTAVAGNLPQFGQVRISKALDEAVRTRKLVQNKQALTSGAVLNLVVYDDDKVTVLQRWNIKDPTGLAIALPAGHPAQRDPV
jgi:hypothetical protein